MYLVYILIYSQDNKKSEMKYIGKCTWNLLHKMAQRYPIQASKQEQEHMMGFIKSLSNYYPCTVCAEHIQLFINNNPPDVIGSDQLQNWFCQLHNSVNIKLGKPPFNCNFVKKRWRNGSLCFIKGKCEKN